MNLTNEARAYSAVLRAWKNDMDEIGWMVVKQGRYVKCFMGFGQPKFDADEYYGESNIQLCIPNLSENQRSVRDGYFMPIHTCPVRRFDVAVLNRLADATLLSNSYLQRQM